MRKEEIKRIDTVHARADQAIAQRNEGHIITECVVLFPNENDGVEAKWDSSALDHWVTHRAKLIDTLASRDYGMALLDEYGDVRVASEEFYDRAMKDPYWKNIIESGRVMYRRSAAYVAIHPAPDPYTQSDRAGLA